MNKKILTLAFLILLLNTGCEDPLVNGLGANEALETDEILTPTEGTDVGNGGDLIQCHPAPPRFFSAFADGWYILDYAELDQTKSVFSKLDLSLEEYLSMVRRTLMRAAPELLNSFDDYLKSVPFSPSFSPSTQDSSNVERMWVSQNKNEEINDEDPTYIPRNCRLDGGKAIKFHQVVVRKESFSSAEQKLKVIYYYDPTLVDKLKSKNLQASMLIVHEWLWDYFDDDQSKRLRIANRLLHNQSAVSIQLLRKALLLD